VLEDNARTPSGVSYMLENRETMLQMFPELFSRNRVQPVQTYPTDLRRSLAACAPEGAGSRPTVAVLTPGIFNSAYFEHASLPTRWGSSWSRGMICAWWTGAWRCAPPKATSPSTCFIAAWMTSFSIR
jgi:uncharacterized circularly permuted ATP-grasp superfamily protein